MGFFFFILVNATLFIRPMEIVPALAEAEEGPLRIYYFLMLATIIFSLPEIIETFTGQSIEYQPVTLCVFGILATAATSHLANGQTMEAFDSFVNFAKVVVYYVLLVSLLNSAWRLRRFVLCLLIFCTILAAVTILQYHEVITLPTLSVVTEREVDRYTGEAIAYSRLQGSGIFQDPNEMGVILACAAALACYQLSRGGSERLLWLGPLALFLYAIFLTRSRGAFLALLGGLGTISLLKLGWRKTVLLGVCVLPLVVVAIGGRQVELSATKGTGQLRVQVWSDYFLEFRDNILFGTGLELQQENLKELRAEGKEFRRVAHNSFLHAFANLGFLGGLCFLGVFYLALWSLWRLGRKQTRIIDPTLERLHPFLLGMVMAYTLGMMSLSLSYMVPTYMIAGLAVVGSRLSPTYPPVPPLRFDLNLLGRLVLVSILFLAFMYVLIRLLLRWT